VILRILIHGINYSPEQIGIGKYTGEMAVWLANRGHEVRMVTAPPYYPSWRVSSDYSAWRYQRECLSGVDVWRCPLWVPLAPSGLKRVLHLLSFTLSSFPIMLRQIFWRPDIVMVIEPSLFCAPQALLTARLSGAKAWLHIQDFEVAAFFGLGFASSGFLKQCIIAIEGWLMRQFDRVSTISNTMVTRIAQLKVPKSRTSLFPNWVDTQHIRPQQAEQAPRSEWGFVDTQRIILYSGNMGKKQGLELILDTAAHFEDTHPEVIFLLAGEGAAKAELVAETEKRHLRNVVFKSLQPLKKLPALLSIADIHLVIQKRGVADAVMPSKLTGILAIGGFSIITADKHTELGQFVLTNPGIAELVDPENKDALIQTISSILLKRGSTGRFNAVARSYAEQHLATDIVMINLEKEIVDMTHKRGL
jgi:colanic acid biosynthesis glycosyl transferase WcaI